jgi:hypothetical protein
MPTVVQAMEERLAMVTRVMVSLARELLVTLLGPTAATTLALRLGLAANNR